MNTVIDKYESLSSLMGLMRDAAAQGQWDRLLDLETQCRRHVESMRQADAKIPLGPDEGAKKRNLILKILADDAIIRRHTQPWMEQLQRVMRSTRLEQQVRRAYGGG